MTPQQGPYGPPHPGVPFPHAAAPVGDDNCVGRRVGQFLVDSLLAIVPWFGLGIAGAALDYAVGSDVFTGVGSVVGFLLTMGLWVWNYIWRPITHEGQTLAMRWLGLRIVTIDGSQVRGRHTALRWLLLIVDGMPFSILYGLVGLVVMLASRQHQRVGDMIAQTRVIRAR